MCWVSDITIFINHFNYQNYSVVLEWDTVHWASVTEQLTKELLSHSDSNTLFIQDVFMIQTVCANLEIIGPKSIKQCSLIRNSPEPHIFIKGYIHRNKVWYIQLDTIPRMYNEPFEIHSYLWYIAYTGIVSVTPLQYLVVGAAWIFVASGLRMGNNQLILILLWICYPGFKSDDDSTLDVFGE